MNHERRFLRLTSEGRSIWSMRQKVRLPLEYRRMLGLVDYCGHVAVLHSLLGRFPRSQVDGWLRQFEESRLIERSSPDIAVLQIARNLQPPPVEPEDNTFYEDVSAFADISLSRMGVYLPSDRMSHRGPSQRRVDQTLALVVEDDPDQCALAVRRLAAAGYRTDAVDCVGALSSYLRKRTPDAIFLDIDLPDGDGFDVLTALRRHPVVTHLPVVMLTARTERADIAKGLALAADAYVTKPYGTNTLEYVLRCLMKQEVQGGCA